MKRSCIKKWIAGFLTGTLVSGGALVNAAVTPEQVEKAIRDAQQYLLTTQGQWEAGIAPANDFAGATSQFGGRTALATYALLASGVSHQAPEMKKAIEFLCKTKMNLVYCIGIRLQVWPLLPQPLEGKYKAMVRGDADLLGKSMGPQGEWRYPATPGAGGDHSVSQYGVLGLWAAAQMGVEIPTEFWQRMDDGWRNTQGADGGWQYAVAPPEKGKATPAMTAAGVATLFITQDYLHRKAGTNCKGNIVNANIDAGLNWISTNFDPSWVSNLYLAYGIERIGVASGYKYFGKHDWYQEGAEVLVKSQANGAWNDGHGGPVCGTAWGILFLTRGRAPVVMNKLQYSLVAKGTRAKAAAAPPKEGPWNQRPRDAAGATQWIAKQIERDLNWQIVNLTVPPEDLLDAPLLYVSGDDELVLSEADVAKLKTYVELGGIILGHADCGKPTFSTSFKKLGQKMFGQKYEWKSVGPKHPMVAGQMFPANKMKKKMDLKELSNGARPLMLLLDTGDPGKAWQTGNASGGNEADYQAMANVFLYAVDKQGMRNKGENYYILRDGKVLADRTMAVARLQYENDSWDPEPGGWVRLSNFIHNTQKLDITAQPVKLGDAKLADFKVAHMTGTGKFKLSPSQRDEIKSFVDAGGTLIVDSAGGSFDFSVSAVDEIKAIFPEAGAKLATLPLKHDLYTLPTSPIKSVGYRAFLRANSKGQQSLREPRIKGMEIGGRVAVFFSEEDLSVGMVGQPIDGIYGYQPHGIKDDKGNVTSGATEIMTNMLLYAAAKSNAAVSTTQPATKPGG